MVEFKEAFAVFDRDDKGVVSVKELGSVLKSVGITATDPELLEMI